MKTTKESSPAGVPSSIRSLTSPPAGNLETLQAMCRVLDADLVRQGFLRQGPGLWVRLNCRIQYRPQDHSFLAYANRGGHEEITFFDLAPDGPDAHLNILLLLAWVRGSDAGAVATPVEPQFAAAM